MSCISSIGGTLYDYCDPHFVSSTFRASYNHSIQPILMSVYDYQVPEKAAVLPTEYKRGPGRRRKVVLKIVVHHQSGG